MEIIQVLISKKLKQNRGENMKKYLMMVLVMVLSLNITGCQQNDQETASNNESEGAVTMIDAITEEDEEALENGDIDETIKGDVLVDKAVVGSQDTKARNLTTKECDVIEKELVNLINKARSTKVTSQKKLETSSLTRAKELKTKFSHTRPNKKSWTTALTAAKVNLKGNATGENLAKLMISAKTSYSQDQLQKYASTIHQSLMNSATHKKVITNKTYKYVGVSVYSVLDKGKVTFYVVEHFTKNC